MNIHDHQALHLPLEELDLVITAARKEAHAAQRLADEGDAEIEDNPASRLLHLHRNRLCEGQPCWGSDWYWRRRDAEAAWRRLFDLNHARWKALQN